MEDLTGKQLGSYQIIEPLGEGGMAAVYKAFQPNMERYVALKILPRHFASDPEFVGRFQQEARVIANLQHPHILPVHDFGEADGYTYLTMRFIKGGTLSDWVKSTTPLQMDKIRRVISQVGGALDYAHAQGVIHRDIKPSNILMDQWENSLLTDFGLAKMVATASHLTQTGGILGTPAYMSPEQGLGKKIDHRSDIYSLGVVLYQMAVGHLPYQAETPMAVVIKHIHDPLPPPRQREPNLAEAVELVILKALTKNPEDRYHSAGDLVQALEEATTTPTVAASASPAAATAVTDPPESPSPVIEEPAPDPTPATVVMESSSTAVPAPTPGPRLTPPETAPISLPDTATPSKTRRFNWRWALAGIGLLFVCFILFAIVVNNQNRNNDSVGGEIDDEISATLDVAINEAIDDAISDSLDDPDIPEAAKALIAIALDAFREGDIDKALESFDQAIAAAPDNADIYCERGYVLRDLEMLAESIADFERCLDLAQQQDNPDQANTALGEAAFTQAQAAFAETNRLEDALAVLDPALESGAPIWLRCERGEFILMAIGPDVAVVPDFEACAQTMTDDGYWSWRATSVLVWVRGINALDNERYEEAAAHFQQWANLVDDSPWPQCYLAFALDELGDYRGATAAFLKCRNLAQDDDTRRQANGGLKYVEAHVAVENGAWDEALAAYDEAIKLLPDDPWLFCERAEVFLMIAEVDPALGNARACLDHSGEDDAIREWAESLIRDIESGG